ncbi:MAG: methionine biosynthesis protein MetW [Spirochaetaceae bacterium]|nr:MAG: methionine biosynthesis protein MetW [Spirochaetaceae bacterium]
MIPENRPHVAYDEIIKLVEPQSTVLDLGCGDGELLQRLWQERGCRGRGVEIDEGHIRTCIGKGISVFQGDLDQGLADHETHAYEYVILNQTLQMVHRPDRLLREMIRVGRNVIIGFPNFGYYLNRLQLLFRGRMPVTGTLPYQWYETPNIHLCTLRDFRNLCADLNIHVKTEAASHKGKPISPVAANLFATEVCFLLVDSLKSI